ncbi:peroxisome biogenesis protein 12 [Lathyrus oleraceus]|uniref:Peroxin-12 n=1 Tax=Pisum sativum TaxID=3888 RepID=A0A9D5ANY3_PEA|nr:peroxisome biogenesis protein 12-like [Pisum sativum]XP_050883641.1 peroxisome biogenesis protein 12-like [Pisum sativum]XP_050883642.1 peroxisome biogenesis protein 12-like [Pisum sativum]XP_050883643.1 peroxisome biogenesis protein 12-like [Pisum sativum]XP_050883644.1 peroxisome biogenesis protein 12-like [Pisum sativum]XP_050887454.1 peroxisome biogenesis protein 12-like [Pisum sativum]XP_050887455.1 peroxisome biogenesis protein 12-like [Pisum sativum]XP_050887456.1 peroxisome biogen
MDASSRISKIRSRERERLRGPQWIKTLQGALLSCTYTVLDYAQTGLIAAVFFFKVAKEGVQLPPDRTVCPLCLQKRVNPSVITVSGFVFCYACVFKFVTQYKRCPATMMPATVDQIRRLFHDV